MLASGGTSAGGSEEFDLVGLVASFLGPSAGSDPDGPAVPSASQSSDADESIPPEANECSMEHEGTIPSARVIVFSKDRPWQLQQLLQSMRLHINDSYDIYIILRASTPEFAKGYEQVMHRYDGMHFLIEDDSIEAKSFSSLLDNALSGGGDTCCENNNSATDDGLVMFLTDDCLLLEPLEDVLACATGALQCWQLHHASSNSIRDEHVFNFSSRLHPGISWCQTRGVASPPPRGEMKFHSLAQYLSKFYEGKDDSRTKFYDGVYLYNRTCCIGEWSYQFDLSGGVYRRNEVLAVLNHMTTTERNHPNTLEMRANQILNTACENATLNEHLSRKNISAIPTRPLMVILAINRVQDVYHAPLALPQRGTTESIGKYDNVIDPSDPASLSNLLDEDCHLDIEQYKTMLYNSSHVGDFFIKQPNKNSTHDRSTSDASPSTHPKVSVLIPVHCGPPDAASHAITSITMQPVEEFHLLCKEDGSLEEYHNRSLLSPLQIVLVDDRCNDGSIDAMIKACEDIVSSHNDVSFTLQDHRIKGRRQKDNLNAGGQKISVSLDIVSSPRAGVACALNHGLRYCQADLVARMDADDVSTPYRLLTLVKFMHANPSFDVIGTSAALFAARQAASGGKHDNRIDAILPYSNLTQTTESYCLLRPSLSISDPGFMAWSMHFTCSIPHPSIVFRKSTVQEVGGYDESILRCEDYDLWLRILRRNSKSIVCLPFLGLWHRKHKLRVGLEAQKKEADCSCFRAMEDIFRSTNDDGPLDIDQVSTLRNPSSAQSPESLDLAAKLLQRLENSFIEKNAHYLSQQEVALIQLDCNARIGELATILVTKFGNKGSKCGSFTWKLWFERTIRGRHERFPS